MYLLLQEKKGVVFIPDPLLEINEPFKEKYKSKRKLAKLFPKIIKKKGKKDGILK